MYCADGFYCEDQVEDLHSVPMGHRLNHLVELNLALSNTLKTELLLRLNQPCFCVL